MKDENDVQTIDWVDEGKLLTDGMYRHVLFGATENLPHSVALNDLIDRTINDITEKQA
jgi:hypothetical protein